jgi:multidrug efflux pump subunit AcrA (membrane-fusion protein)
VWKYDGKTFVPVPVRTGVSDEQWTELIDGAIAPGDRLVTSATVGSRSSALEPGNP